MAAAKLKGMDIDALMALRADIDKQLDAKRRDLEAQLSRLSAMADTAAPAGRRGRRGRPRKAHPLKGAKVPPKYRGPGGETWAGRAAQPRWLTELLKQGHKLEEFAISKGAGAARKASGRGRRKRA